MGNLDAGYFKKLPAKVPTGPGVVLTLPALSALGGHRIIRYEAGELVYADNTDPIDSVLAFGMTLHAASAGTLVGIITSGFVEESSWTWTPDGVIYLSVNGLMTQVVPTTGFVLPVGKAISATKMYFDIQPPILLEP